MTLVEGVRSAWKPADKIASLVAGRHFLDEVLMSGHPVGTTDCLDFHSADISGDDLWHSFDLMGGEAINGQHDLPAELLGYGQFLAEAKDLEVDWALQLVEHTRLSNISLRRRSSPICRYEGSETVQ